MNHSVKWLRYVQKQRVSNENKELDSVKLEDKEVEIFGNRDELQNINEITAEVDIDGISESTEKTVSFNLPKDVTKVNQRKQKRI